MATAARKRTNINLDMELVISARELLGTEGITDTVHAALDEIVKREKRRQLMESLNVPTPEELAEMRKPRFTDWDGPSRPRSDSEAR